MVPSRARDHFRSVTDGGGGRHRRHRRLSGLIAAGIGERIAIRVVRSRNRHWRGAAKYVMASAISSGAIDEAAGV
jgi:hypothetical protein